MPADLCGLAFDVAVRSLAIHFVLFCACGSPEPPTRPGLLEPPCTLSSTFFTIDEIVLPPTEVDAIGWAFDADGDGRPQNVLGRWYADLVSVGAVLRPQLDTVLTDGRLIWLLEIQTCDDDSSEHARIALHQGTDGDGDPTNNLEIDSELGAVDNASIPAVGRLSGTDVEAAEGVGVAPIAAMYDVEPPPLVSWELVDGLAVKASLSGSRVAGVLGACQETERARFTIAEPSARTLSMILMSDPGCPQACSMEAAQLVEDLFDENGDGIVTDAELLDNLSYRLGVDEDSDLTAESGGETVYWPLQDGIKEHSCLATQFRGVRATVR